jgi:predicted lipid-binding transport protein (Tim44 family)
MLKGTLTLSLLALASAALIATDVDAARLGGGRSFGTQRNVAPAPSRPATPQAPASAGPTQPATPDAAAAPRAQTPPPPAPPASGSRWLAPLAGLAAGLGLAALLSNFGLSADFGGALLVLLAIAAAVFVLRRMLARPASPGAPLQYAPASIAARETTGAVPPAHVTARFPADFDAARFLAPARIAFNRLQAAFNGGDRRMLAEMMTPQMYAEVSRDLDARGDHTPTEVVKLDADVTEVVTEGDRHWASVRFSGLLREDGNPLPKEFDELWHLTKPVDDSHGWLLAGIQQMQEAVH